ncbi:TPA: type VI secretion system tip protein VgrG [Burkholderia aenigmatica]|uniref:type VI secretion system Vgr family protein n=1 Tax=Burkholderia sp. AU45251 TaxID=3059204 RepID=UPI002656DC11|nr:type VI secretion system Vgr family protein [Burkholderia sp. AU45251]HDR9485243.1 type VI secretion system tip protein VgrG [Burkholderia aenigmatica]MDN7515518.1 type VI secretion system Vgr family protein [Burkholderia sp. AU45251]HDR9516790.1 type VI secretion system tip protein VgrG [Burkholderia aenigmatica]HDR9593850.1 type VI secretion system tip protein VgrG [Burkholderia aenigmatica]HDR9602156.1 type VI secretion system tip protein VgrG [Burkholderia aenigmatica]
MTLRPADPSDLTFRQLYENIHRGLMQHDRLLMFRSPLGPQTLIPVRARGWEKIGRGYRWTVDVVSLRDDIDNLALQHQAVTLFLKQQAQPYTESAYRPIHGFVCEFNKLGLDGNLTVYQVEFESALYFLGKAFRDDHWIKKDAREILLELTERYPQLRGRLKFILTRQPDVRPYTRQKETDLNFFHRILEDEGWYFYFEHAPAQYDNDPRVTTLVIVDRLSALPDAQSVEFYRGNAGDEAEGLSQWAVKQVAQSTAYGSTSFNFKDPTHSYAVSSELDVSASTYPVEERGQQVWHGVPSVPTRIQEALPYAYPTTDAGHRRAEIRTEAWASAARRYIGVGGARWFEAGWRFALEHHTWHTERDPRDREFLIVEAEWFIENNVPLAGHAGAYPLSLQRELADLRREHGDQFNVQPHLVDGTGGFYRVKVEAQRTHIEYRSPFEHPKSIMHPEPAIVTGPENEEAWSDERNRVYVVFPWDTNAKFETTGTSPPLSTLQADTGQDYGGVHVPRIGEAVQIGYQMGDCDRPYVMGRLPTQRTQPQWHSTVLLSGFKSNGFGQTGAYNAFVHDDATHQSAARLTTYTGDTLRSYSLYHQGVLIDHSGRNNARGRFLGLGALLHTDHYLAIRATGGAYIGTHPNAFNDDQLNVQQAQGQLIGAESLIETLSNVGVQHHADSLKDSHDALKAFTDATQQSSKLEARGGRTANGGTGSANAFKKAILLLASPFGIGLSTQDSMHLAADRHLNLVSALNTHIATARAFIVNAASSIGMFTQAAMKLFAKGPVQIQSHDANIELIAQKVLKLLAHGDVEIAAGGKLVLTAGGASLTLEGGNILGHAPGMVEFKGASHSFSGPASTRYTMPALPVSTLVQNPTHEYTQIFDVSSVIANLGVGRNLEAQTYRIYMPDGTIQQQGGLLKGMTATVHTPEPTKVRCEIGGGDWHATEDSYDHAELRDEPAGEPQQDV